jgi:hypothetical protein
MKRFLLLCLVLCPLAASAQNASVGGVVQDPSGAVVPKASVEFRNQDTGIRRQTTTNGNGLYQIEGMDPGKYDATVQANGFKTMSREGVVFHVADTLRIDFKMQIGESTEHIDVDGSGLQINTTNGSVSTVIDRNLIESLPLNGRSFNTLIQLTPGAVIAQQPSGSAAGTAPGQFSIGGQRTDANSFTVDGVSANFGVSTNGLYSGESGTGSDQAFSALGGTSSLVSVEALQEFRIETSSFAPEYGKSPGGQVILTTRPGTNTINAGIYEYFRNDVMDANDWFAKQAGLPRAEERHNDFGGYVGGPFWKNKTFYFFSYEGARLRLPQTAVTQVPYLNSTTCVAPAAVAPFLNAYPHPNGATSSTTCTGTFTGSFSNSATLNATALRIDHTLNSRFSIFGRLNYAPSSTTSRVYTLNMLQATPVNTETMTVGVNMVLTKSVVNLLRGNYSRQSSNSIASIDSFGGAQPINASLILGSISATNSYAFFETDDTNAYGIGPLSRNKTQQVNIVDDLSVGIGTHDLKAGVDSREIILDKDPHSSAIVFDASTVSALLASSTLTTLTATTNAASSFLTTSTSLYAQDTWRINHKLTMTYGLRWELAPAPTPRNNTQAASWQNVSNPSAISLAPFGTPLWATTYSNFAPRLGIAWTPMNGGGLVVRIGGGVFYDLGTGRAADVATFFPGQFTKVATQVPLPVSNTSSYLPSASTAPPYPVVSAFNPNLSLPRSYQWNAAVEQPFSNHQALTISYVGQAGRELLRQQALYKPNPNFSTAFLLTGNDAESNYNALEVQYQRPVYKGLQALLNYTWSHSLDNASDDVVAGLADTIISGASDYAPSSFDVRHSFSGALTYSLRPLGQTDIVRAVTGGWSVGSVIVIRTGFPFNGRLLSLAPLTGGYVYSRPDVVPGQPKWLFTSSAGGGKALNPNAFAIPSTLRQGTEGRDDIVGFDLTQVDLSVGREFSIHEKLKMKFRTDAFNVLNHPNFTNPTALIGYGPIYLQSSKMLNSGLGGLNPLFQEGGPRSLQLSLTLQY